MQSPAEHYLSCDYWRGIAILSVVLFHFDFFRFGYLGVDLFFVLSGFLVSRSLIDQMNKRGKIFLSRFFVARFLKILPMYFCFLVLGNAVAFALYSRTHPEQFIPLSDLAKYAFFFLNYRSTNHFSFDHIWSLCVEEHFYLLLPLGLLLISSLRLWSSKNALLIFGACMLGGNLLRGLSYAVGFETYSATHNRLDALCWGVILSLIVQNKIGQKLLGSKIALAGGALIVFVSVALHMKTGSDFFKKVAFHGLVPAGFFLLLAGSHGFESRKLRWLSWVSRYSFGWYLWHMLFYWFAKDHFGSGVVGFLFFAGTGLGLAILTTHLIEDNCMSLKNRLYPQTQTARLMSTSQWRAANRSRSNGERSLRRIPVRGFFPKFAREELRDSARE